MPNRNVAGTTTPKSSPKPNGCHPSASSRRSLNFRTTFSRVESTTAARITPSAPRTRRPLTSRPRTRLRETPPSKTTASVFCIEFITRVAPQSASPRVKRPARLQGEGTEVISVSSLRDPLRRESELVADRGDETPLIDPARREHLGEDRRHEGREGNSARRAHGRRSPQRTASRRGVRRGRSPPGRGR